MTSSQYMELLIFRVTKSTPGVFPKSTRPQPIYVCSLNWSLAVTGYRSPDLISAQEVTRRPPILISTHLKSVMKLAGHVEIGDEVIVMEPFFDCYDFMIKCAGGVPRFIALQPVRCFVFFKRSSRINLQKVY